MLGKVKSKKMLFLHLKVDLNTRSCNWPWKYARSLGLTICEEGIRAEQQYSILELLFKRFLEPFGELRCED